MPSIKKIYNRLTGPRVDYQPLIEVRIFKDALLHNLHTFQKTYPNFKFAPVLKSNAYGHGLVNVAKILDQQAIAFFMVDSFFEAYVLKREGIKNKILVLGYASLEQINKNKSNDISFAIIDLQQLKNIAASLKHQTRFHLKIDTGMHRQGILPEDLAEAIRLIKSNGKIVLEGACSHFADADGVDPGYTKGQIAAWNQIVKSLKKEFPGLEYLHLSNTAGATFLPEIEANVARIGIGLYGFNNSPRQHLNLRPALEMASIVTSIKTIPKGAKVGYNTTYEAPQETKIATVPVGYNEGVDVRLSNKGFLKVKGVFCPIVGRVSMNMCSINVSQVPDVKLEDEVIVISSNSLDKNSIDSIVNLAGTGRYEIPIHIPQHLRRIVV